MPARAAGGMLVEVVVKILRQFMAGVVCVGLCAMVGVCSEQSAGQQGLGNVQGKVVQDAGGVGIRKVVVQLTGGSGEASEEYTTSTDATGQFRIEGVATGKYSVRLLRAGFVRVDTKQDDPKITVGAGQELTGLVYKMQATGVIAGKITEADGDPLEGVNVWVTRVGTIATEFDAHDEGNGGQGTTNDLGEFRVANLRAGQYIVQAQAHGMGPAPDSAEKGKQKDKALYALTYFPGTLDVKTALPVRVSAGGTAAANFGVLTSKSYRVSGTVTVAGNPRNVQMFLVSATGQTEAQGLQGGGRFEFQNVLPGTYVAQIVDMSSAGEGRMAETHTQMIGSPIVVTNADVTGLVLQPEAGGSVSGKVRAEGGETLDWKEITVSLIRVTEADELPQLSAIGALGGNVGVKEDATFALKDVAGANYWVYVMAATDKLRDYYLKSVLVEGRESVETGFAVNGETVLDVVMSVQGASVEGTVVDSKGRDVSGVAVVSLPSTGKVGREDFYQVVTTDASGHYLMRGMPPGSYVLVAIEGVREDTRKPEFFQQYGEKGQTVDLEEGQKKSVTLTMATEE